MALEYREDGVGREVLYKATDGGLRRRPGQAGAHLEPRSAGAPSSPGATPTGTSPCCASPARPSRPALRLLLLHDDAEREFDYTAGAEAALERARAQGWTVISLKNDWATVFAP